MKLHELKATLESDATKRLDAQETTIRKLNAEIRDMQTRLIQAYNRCYVACRGTLCCYCGEQEECRKERTIKQFY